MATRQERLLSRARELAAQGRHEAALVSYRELCAAEPYNPLVWLERANSAESAGALDEAVDALFHVTDLYASAGMAEAAEIAERVLALRPDHAEAARLRDIFAARRLGGLIDTPDAPAGPQSGSAVVPRSAPHKAPAARARSGPVSARSSSPVSGSSGLGFSPRSFGSSSSVVELSDGIPVAVADGGRPQPVYGTSVSGSLSDAVLSVIAAESSSALAESIPLPAMDAPSGPVHVIRRSVPTPNGGVLRRAPADPPSAGPRPSGGSHERADLRERLAALSSPLLERLGSGALDMLLNAGEVVHCHGGDVVFHQGDVGTSLYIILEGELDVERREGAGAAKLLAVLKPGAFFGEMALLAGEARSATVRARSETVLLKLSRKAVRTVSEQDDRVLTTLMRFFRARLVGTLMATSPLFTPLPAAERRSLVNYFRLRELPPGQVVLQQGRLSDGLYLVLVGELVASIEDGAGEGGHITELGKLRPGDVFGEMSLLAGEPAMASIRTRERTWLLRLPKEEFDRVARAHPEMLRHIHGIAAKRREKNLRTLERDWIADSVEDE